MRILVFPAGMAEARAYARMAQQRGERGDVLIGASSVPVEAADREGFAAWAEVPFVTRENFAAGLSAVLIAHGIEGVYCPHPVIWQKLWTLLPDAFPGLVLLNAHPVDEVLSPWRHAVQEAQRMCWHMDGLESVVTMPPPWLRAGLLHALDHVPGQSSVAKLSFLMSVALNAPTGDFIEIGTLWGRSAHALAQAASHAGNGPLICVEPWKNEAYAQPGSSPMLAAAAAHFDAEEAHACFLAHLAPFAGRVCNYLRMPSTEAAVAYAQTREVRSAAYGTTPVAGRIALLHIDGNHDREAVEADLSAWTPRLTPAGWVVLDDYHWPFGDGPRQAGNAWLAANAKRVDVAFVAFDCLWIRMHD